MLEREIRVIFTNLTALIIWSHACRILVALFHSFMNLTRGTILKAVLKFKYDLKVGFTLKRCRELSGNG